MSGRRWTEEEDATLRARYADEPTRLIAADIGRTALSVYQHARSMGLTKSESYLSSEAARRIQQADKREAFRNSRFKRGHATWNKGVKGSTGHQDACKAHHFKPGTISGRAAQRLKPLGAFTINADGCLEIKVSEISGARKLRWKPYHRVIWERAHGPVPAGSIIVFKSGMHTTDPELITLDRLECITRKENILRNSYLRYGKEVAALIRLRGAIARQINKRAKNEQDT